MLRNVRYRGVATWNRTRKVHDPRTGRRIPRVRPTYEWVTLRAPHLQIVSDEVWSAVERWLAVVNVSFAVGTSPGLCCQSLSAQYLLSGFLKCGMCGTKMVVVSGRGSSGQARYGCPMKHARGICPNNLQLRQDTLEREIIGGLHSRVLHDAYTLCEFKRQLTKKLEGARSQLG
jgi:site-specific DNA recombinase